MTTEHSSKRCTKCGEEKLLSEFYADSRRKDGRRAKCKLCFPPTTTGKRTPEQRAAYRRKTGQTNAPYRTIAQIRAETAEKRVLRQQEAALLKEARAANRRPAEGSKEWYRTATEQEIADYRAYHRLKYQRRYALHGEQERARATLYKHVNPEKLVQWGDRRKRLMAESADGSLTKEVIRRMFADAVLCPYCASPFKGRMKTLDHVTPLSLGGTHSEDNAAVCCKTCNLRKRAKPLLLWMMSKGNGSLVGIGAPGAIARPDAPPSLTFKTCPN